MGSTDKRAEEGHWGELFELGNVAVHMHLLYTGEVLFWGRRSQPKNNKDYNSLNEHKTLAYLINLEGEKPDVRRTATDPVNEYGLPVNLFCSGHTFQPDGSLLVLGGHVLDGFGEDQACIYHPGPRGQERWEVLPTMMVGRWYPTAITLSDGRALVLSGSSQNGLTSLVPQVWNSHTNKWGCFQTPERNIFSLYPRLFHCPDGKIFMAGPLPLSKYLDPAAERGAGKWSDGPARREGVCEYGASAMYDAGKIIYISGGGGDDREPTKYAEIIDLDAKRPKWRYTTPIHRGRRHAFATTLPDGTVLVTGGTDGVGFNNVEAKHLVKTPEIWDPDTEDWSVMAPEVDERCYHHTAVLLPDGRVLSAGSGEWDPGNQRNTNEPKNTITTAQIFSPPYLFKGAPPTVSGAPDKGVDYGQTIDVTVGEHDQIDKVSLTRLASVTHCHNMNSSFQFLKWEQNENKVKIHVPTNKNITPPGHYMLFLINKAGVPGKAPIILIKPDGLIPIDPPIADPLKDFVQTIEMRDQSFVNEQDKPPVVVGITPVCPYGLGPCWAGAYEALGHVQDISSVRPRPNQADSLAFVYLREDILPDIDIWRQQFHEIDGGTYTMRGIEMTLTGDVSVRGVKLILAGNETRADLELNRYSTESKLEWDARAKAPRPVTSSESDAYSTLYQKAVQHQAGENSAKPLTLTVSGRLQKSDDGKYSLDVKGFVDASFSW